jgi:hypothetical protein
MVIAAALAASMVMGISNVYSNALAEVLFCSFNRSQKMPRKIMGEFDSF